MAHRNRLQLLPYVLFHPLFTFMSQNYAELGYIIENVKLREQQIKIVNLYVWTIEIKVVLLHKLEESVIVMFDTFVQAKQFDMPAHFRF